MRPAARFVSILLLSLGAASAQRETPYKGHGYVFFAPGATAGNGNAGYVHYGGGGEAIFGPGIGFGAEVGYAHPLEEFGAGIGIASVNGLYQFGKAWPKRKVVPFVTGGYSLAFRRGSENFANLGGGVTWWFREKMGFRFEVRDHLDLEHAGIHLVSFRFGVAFR